MHKQIYFVRHGQTTWNAARRMQGRLDSPLTELGVSQAEASAAFLAGRPIEALFASPLGRARQTAMIVGERIGLPIDYDPRLMEWDCGDFGGHLYDEAAERWPTEWAALQADRFHYRGPGCENYPDMIERVAPFLLELREAPAKSVAIVSHGIIGRVMIASLLGLDEAATLGFAQSNDLIVCVTLSGSGALAEHFVGGAGPRRGLPATGF